MYGMVITFQSIETKKGKAQADEKKKHVSACVVWNRNLIFPHVWNFIIRADFPIFQRGRLNHLPDLATVQGHIPARSSPCSFAADVHGGFMGLE